VAPGDLSDPSGQRRLRPGHDATIVDIARPTGLPVPVRGTARIADTVGVPVVETRVQGQASIVGGDEGADLLEEGLGLLEMRHVARLLVHGPARVGDAVGERLHHGRRRLVVAA